MRPIVVPDAVHREADAFDAELTRLEGEIRKVNQRLDRLEEEALQALNDLALERFEENR
jgi:hypothetical protein